jgi:hypothetical protein
MSKLAGGSYDRSRISYLYRLLVLFPELPGMHRIWKVFVRWRHRPQFKLTLRTLWNFKPVREKIAYYYVLISDWPAIGNFQAPQDSEGLCMSKLAGGSYEYDRSRSSYLYRLLVLFQSFQECIAFGWYS